jgi:GDPmannose 4,6-dehydratase
MFGNSGSSQLSETTTLNPQSPYAAAKVFGHNIARIYRQAYGIYVATGICFNHESPRRGTHFVSRKISLGVARIAHGLQEKLVLGNIDARRDWGYAGDYVRAMWLSLQQAKGDDFVIATGESHSVREFLELAFARIGVSDWQRYVVQDKKYLRPLDITDLRGDSTKARDTLDWKPTVGFEELVSMMIDADIARISKLSLPHE